MKQINTHVVLQKSIPPGVLEVLTALTLSAENIDNSNLFNQRNLMSSYQYDPEKKKYFAKEKPHIHQVNTLLSINAVIEKLNTEQAKKREQWNALTEKSKLITPEPKNKQFTRYESEIDQNTYWQFLNKTIAEKLTHSLEKTRPAIQRDYALTPSGYAQNILHQSVQTMGNYRASLIAYAKDKSKFTGKPQTPNYLSSGARRGFEISATRLSKKNGSLPHILPTHQLFLDKGKTKPVSQQSIDAFNSFNFKKLIDDKMFRLNPEAKLGTIRVIVVKRSSQQQKVKVAFTTSETWTFPKNSLAALIEDFEPQFFEKNDSDQTKMIQKFLSSQNLPQMAGIDLGLRNIVSIAFSNALKSCANKVFSGKGITDSLSKLDTRLDRRIAEIANAEVQRLRATAEQEKSLRTVGPSPKTILNADEINTLHAFNSTMYSDSKYLKLLEEKNHRIDDICHKISRTVVNLMVKNGVELIVIGKNLGWKEELNLGKKRNREFCNFPHARLIELIRYKALRQNILVATTEESYTSKASFFYNDEIPVYSENTSKKQPFSGVRNSKKHRFINRPVKNEEGSRNHCTSHFIHDDINGAFNIIRKLTPRFKYNKDIFLGHEICHFMANCDQNFLVAQSFT